MKVKHFREKIVGIDDIGRIADSARAAKRTIVTSNGCFDILHNGHIEYLQAASAFGDILIVGINSDSSVKKLKGKGRPINAEMVRASIVASLGFVDYCVIFSQDTPEELLETIRPDVHVKGGDYIIDNIIEKNTVEKYGGKVKIVPFLEGHSTTGIIKKMKKR